MMEQIFCGHTETILHDVDMGFFRGLVQLLNQMPGPPDVANKVGWWRGDAFDSTTNGDEVTAWADRTASKSLAANGSAANRLTVARNSIDITKTTVDGDLKRGLKYASGGTLFTLSGDWTVWFVIRLTGNAGTENDFFAMGTSGSPAEARLFHDLLTNKLGLVYNSVGSWLTNELVTFAQHHVIAIVNSGGTETFYLNDVALTWGTTPGTRSANISDITVGEGFNSSGFFFKGKIAEVIVFSDDIGTSDLTLLYDYAVDRYNLTLVDETTTHTYVSNGDTNGIFYYLGIIFGENGTWVNPATITPLVLASYSSRDAGSSGTDTETSFTNRIASRFVTNNVANSFIKWDFGANQSVNLNAWTFENWSLHLSFGVSPTTLLLEGSNDNSSWNTLDSHASLTWSGNSQVKNWSFTATGVFYRYIRLTQNGLNTSGTDAFTVGEVELYGEFKRQTN